MVSHLASAAGLAGPWVMSSDSPGVPEADPAACAAEALRLLQAHAYFADRVDWVSVTAEVSRAVDGSLLLITTSLAVDRRGRCHAAAVVPGREGGVAEAGAWLDTQRPR
ncbi:MAG TPA: hypothetical protein VK735_30700 [Pseudonocardia sp.]|uniref:hypothetical protein n=1 Tax=Pseudonocardia sp. TaxID=60912 RepID=UPI002D0876CC|nr:hypothetical protein [Pseudonocardia sp.]HTF51837.1 hypothetical protein [Pseudonocardia sp.]